MAKQIDFVVGSNDFMNACPSKMNTVSVLILKSEYAVVFIHATIEFGSHIVLNGKIHLCSQLIYDSVGFSLVYASTIQYCDTPGCS